MSRLRPLLRHKRHLLVWAAIVALLGLRLDNVQDATRADLEQRFALRATLAADFVDTFVAELARRQRALAARRLAAARPKEVDFDSLVSGLGFEMAVLLDGRGRLLHVAPDAPGLRGRDMTAKYDHLRRAAQGETAVSDVVPSAARGVPVVAVAVPFDTPHGRRVISGAYEIARTPVGAYLRSALPLRTGRSVLVDGRGTVVAASGAPNAEVHHRVVERRPVGGTPWRLTISADDREIFAPIHSANRILPWIGLGVIASLGFAFMFAFARRKEAEKELLEEREFLHALLDSLDSGIVACDADGRLNLLNPAVRALHDRGADGIPREDWAAEFHLFEPDGRTLLHPDRVPLARALDGERVRDVPMVVAPPGTEPRRMLANGQPILHPGSGARLGAVVAMRDVTEQEASEAARRAAEERFRRAFEDAGIGMGLVGLDGRWLRVNRSLARMLGYTAEQLTRLTFQDITHPDDLETDLAQHASTLAGETTGYRIEKRYFTSAGVVLTCELTVSLLRDATGEPQYFIAQVQDVSERRRMEDELAYLADHDPLTGVANRRCLERDLARQVDHVARYGSSFALLLLDLDDFKHVNDTLGHPVGDRVLSAVAATLRQRLRSSDVLARLGGDEFAVILPEADADRGRLVGQDLLEAIRSAVVVTEEGEAVRVTGSIGIVATDPDRPRTADQLLMDADVALYAAKASGRSRVALRERTEDAAQQLRDDVAWIDRVRRALETDAFVLYGQPIFDLRENVVTRQEVLLRMVDDDGSHIAPGTFLPVAERFGMIEEIDRWVVERAIACIAAHERIGRPAVLEVNLSGASVTSPELLQTIEDRLRETGIDPASLIFEITETAAIDTFERARVFAERLSRLGCRFALDDFGAGFGSFRYLKHLPFDVLKIDGEFVRDLVSSPRDRIMVRSVARIAADLGAETVAEFVQDEVTKDLLRRIGVDFAQGYGIGRPAPLLAPAAAAA